MVEKRKIDGVIHNAVIHDDMRVSGTLEADYRNAADGSAITTGVVVGFYKNVIHTKFFCYYVASWNGCEDDKPLPAVQEVDI